MTDLKDLPIPTNDKKPVQAAILGFNDFDDWDLDDAEVEVKDNDLNDASGKSFDNKFSNSTSPDKSSNKTPEKWEPPKPAGKLVDKKQN